MVSSDEINRRLEARRRGVKYPEPERTTIPTGSRAEPKECPNCDTNNPSSAKFCVGCGEKLPTKEAEKEFSPIIKGPETEEDKEPVEKPIKAGISQRPDDFGRGGIQKIKEKIDASEPAKEEPPVPEVIEVEESAEPEPQVIKEESLVKKVDQTAIPVTPVEKETAVPDKPSKSEVDPVERIKRAKELLDIGALTQEEFDIIKKKYLDDI